MIEFLVAMLFSGSGIAALVLGYLVGNVLSVKRVRAWVKKLTGKGRRAD